MKTAVQQVSESVSRDTSKSFSIINRLLLMNGIAVAMAVSHHAIHWVLMGMFYWTNRYKQVSVPNFDALGSPQYNLLRIIDQFSGVGVPVFLFVSGYFIAIATGRGSKPLSWRFVFNRIRDLLIPYLIWCMAYLTLDIAKGEPFSLREALIAIATGRLAPPFYYVVLLAQLFVLSPFLMPLLSRNWKIVLVCAALIQLPGILGNHTAQIFGSERIPTIITTLYFRWDVPTYLLWFLLGATAGMRLNEFKLFLERNRLWLLPAALTALIFSMVEWEWLRQASGREWLSPQEMFFNRVYALFAILGFFSLPNLEKRLPTWLATLGTKSFGVYLIHSLVQEIIARMAYHFTPSLLAYPLLFFVILWAAGLLVPYMMIIFLERSPAKRFVKTLTGV